MFVYATSTPLTSVFHMLLNGAGVFLVIEFRDQWPEIPIAMGYIRILGWKSFFCVWKGAFNNSSLLLLRFPPGMADGIRHVLGKYKDDTDCPYQCRQRFIPPG